MISVYYDGGTSSGIRLGDEEGSVIRFFETLHRFGIVKERPTYVKYSEGIIFNLGTKCLVETEDELMSRFKNQ